MRAPGRQAHGTRVSEAAHSDDPAGPLDLPEYHPGASAVLSDAERWPTLDAAGIARLRRWRDHPHAPMWTHATGDRMDAATAASAALPLSLDGWLDAHLEIARRLIHYREIDCLDLLEDFPPISRADLVADVAAFVPLDADLDQAVHGSSSGSTGAALVVPDDLEDNARTFHLLRDLVQREGVTWEADPERMALAYVLLQREAFTYVSLITGFESMPMARLNLEASQWPTLEARAAFLADANPQVITGDPASLEALLDPDLAAAVHPLALFSGATALSAPLRAALERRFGCPVFDLYGLHETRPIGVRTDSGPFRVLDRRVKVEILDAKGSSVPHGAVGEITVTAGHNRFLPLVRYRTGDFGALVTLPDGGIGIAGLEGRENTTFWSADGVAVPCVDLTQHLQAHGSRAWAVEQRGDGSVEARIAGGDSVAVARALEALLPGVEVAVTDVGSVAALGSGKPRRYRSSASAAATRLG